MAQIITPAVVTAAVVTLVSDLTVDRNSEAPVQSFRVSFPVDATAEGLERLMASLRKAGVVADGIKTVEKEIGKAAGKATAGSQEDTTKLREWAAEVGITLSARGRLPLDVKTAFTLEGDAQAAAVAKIVDAQAEAAAADAS